MNSKADFHKNRILKLISPYAIMPTGKKTRISPCKDDKRKALEMTLRGFSIPFLAMVGLGHRLVTDSFIAV